jgi:protein-tyrosine phosphatase
MLRLASSFGFSTLVATPHLQSRVSDDYLRLVEEAFASVLPHAQATGIALRHGFEVRIDPGLPAWLGAGDPIALAGSRTILIELPFSGWPTFTEQVLFDVQTAGYTPLLAHPERYAAAMQEPDLLLNLHERGVLFQVTTGSISGLFGKGAKALSELLLRRGAVDILASDAHSAGRRFVSVAEGLARATDLVGERRVHELTVLNPAALLDDRAPIPADVEIQPGRNDGGKSPLARVRQLLPGR